MQELESANKSGVEGYSSEELAQMKAEQEKELDYYRQQMKDQEAAWKRRLEEARREMEVSGVADTQSASHCAFWTYG